MNAFSEQRQAFDIRIQISATITAFRARTGTKPRRARVCAAAASLLERFPVGGDAIEVVIDDSVGECVGVCE